MRVNRRAFLALAASTCLWSSVAYADGTDFPNRPVKMIVAFTPGTGSDLLVRNIAPQLAEFLGKPVVVENRPGGGGVIGTEAGARAAPDGYTLTVASSGAMIIVPAMRPSTPYRQERDFVPIGGLARSGYVIVTANTEDAPKTFEELVERVRASPEPTNFASPGAGTATHLAGEVILRRAGMKGTHVSYRGSAQALGDIASGQILFGFDTTGAALPLIKSGKLRALAVSSAKRRPTLPDVPTLGEAGLRDFSLDGWWGLFAPKDTPREIVAKLSRDLIKALGDPAVQERLALQEVEAFPIGSDELAALIARESPLFGELIADAGLRQE